MEIDHEKLEALNAQLSSVLDKEKPANEAPKEVQDCLLLLTYHFAALVYESESPKDAVMVLPKEWQEDVRAVAKLIHQHRKKDRQKS